MASARTDDASQEPSRPQRRWRRLLRAPLFAKILVANGAVVTLGATAGTYLTTQHVRQSPRATHYEIMALFAVTGMALSLLLNAAVLRTALRPLARLERTAQRVQAGDLGARVRLGAVGDPETDRLATTLNAMLDRLRERNRQVEAYASLLQELSHRLLLAQEEERHRLAARLLDDTSQELAALLLHLRLCQQVAAAPDADVATLAKEVAGLAEPVRDTLDGVRRLAQDLRPRLLDDLGLVAALRAFAREWTTRTSIPVDLRASVPPDARLSPDAGIAVYRMVQEALANVARQGRASGVRLTLASGSGELVVDVQDDGRGPIRATEDPATCLALFAMQERISLAGGRLAVKAAPGLATVLRATVPLSSVEEAGGRSVGAEERDSASSGRVGSVAAPLRHGA